MHSGVVIRSGMGDRSGAKTGLVGEHAASDASLDSGGDGYAGNAADNCGGGEGAHEDAAEHVAYVAYVCKEDYQCGDDVDHRHEGDQLFSDLAYALEAAQQHHCAERRHYDADYEVSSVDVDGGEGVDGAGDRGNYGVDLGHVAYAEGRKHSEQCKQRAQPDPFLAEAVLDVVHGAAYPVALVVALAEVYGQGDLSELSAHSEQGGYPHPENRAGAAEGDSAGNAGDISGADRRRKGGTHGLEGSYGALAGFLLVEDLADGGLHYVAEPLELYPAAANRVIHAGAYQKDHARPAHYDAVKEGVYFYDKFHQN